MAPDAGEWRSLIDRFLLAFGAALIVAGVTAFFAYNWAGLHKFGKFGLIEAGIIAGVAGTRRSSRKDRAIGGGMPGRGAVRGVRPSVSDRR